MKMKTRTFRELLGYSPIKREIAEEKILDFAAFDGISFQDALENLDKCRKGVLEKEWYMWLNIGLPDYEIYQHSLFKYDNYDWYFTNSEHDFIWTLDKMNDMEIEGKVIDFGGGNGDFAIAMNALAYDITYYNLPGDTTEFVKWQTRKDLSLNIATELPDEKFQVVTAFEVSEHFEHPQEFIDQILSLIEPGGIFIETSSFSSKSCGHFDMYYFDGQAVDMKATGRRFGKEMRKHFSMEAHGWNGRPKIWRRNERKKNV